MNLFRPSTPQLTNRARQGCQHRRCEPREHQMGARKMERALQLGGTRPYVRGMGTAGTRSSRCKCRPPPSTISAVGVVPSAAPPRLTSTVTTAPQGPRARQMGHLRQRSRTYIHQGPRCTARRCRACYHALARPRRWPIARRRPRPHTPPH